MRILKIVPSDFKNESRDLREMKALNDEGHQIAITGLHKNETYRGQVSGMDLIVYDTVFRNMKSMLGKLLRYIIYAIKVVSFSKNFKPDVISAHDLQCLIIAMIIKVLNRRRVVIIYDSHELTAEMASHNHLPNWLVKMKNWFEAVLITRSDKVMVVSDSIADYNYKRYGLLEMPTVVRNIPEFGKLDTKDDSFFRDKLGLDKDAVILIYQGSISEGRGIGPTIRALTLTPPNVVMVIMGYGNTTQYRSVSEECGVAERVFFVDAVPYADLLNVTASADIGVCLIENYCLSYYYSLPNKLFEYIQSGLPVIASNFPEMTTVVSNYGVRVTSDPNDPSQIAAAIQTVITTRDSFQRPLQVAKKELCWEVEKRKLVKMYDEALLMGL